MTFSQKIVLLAIWEFSKMVLHSYYQTINGNVVYKYPYSEMDSLSWILMPQNPYVRYILAYLGDELNLFSTGYCVLALAMERFILVCLPFRAEKLLTKNNRVFASIALSLLLLFITVYNQLCSRLYSPHYSLLIKAPAIAKYTCYPETRSEILAKTVLFFVIPASVTSFLYIMIGAKLSKVKTNRNRNSDLTKAFLISCILWILLWFPDQLAKLIKWFPEEHSLVYYTTTSSTIAHVLFLFSRGVFMFYCLLNPVIFIFVSRGFQKPIKKFLKLDF